MAQPDYSLLNVGSKGFNTPFENLSAVLQVKNQQIAGQALADERNARAEKNRQDIEAQRQAQAQAEAFRALWGRTDPTSGQPMLPTLEESAQVIGPEAATKVFQGIEALKKSQWENAQTAVSGIAAVLDGIEAWPEPDRPTVYADTRKALIQQGKIREQDAPATYSPQWVKQKQREAMTAAQRIARDAPPADYTLGDSRISGATNQPIATAAPPSPKPAALGSFEDYVNRYATQRRLKPEQLSPGDIAKAKAQFEAAGRAPQQAPVDNSPLETIIGPDGTPIRVRRADAIGKAPATGTMKPASGVEKRALNFFNRAEQADGELEKLEAEIQKMGLASQGRLSYAPNFMQSQLGQSYGAAQRAFTEARLRKDSGAAIPPQEFENDRQTYFAQPGDSKETLEQKRRARAAILASLAFESGQALGEFIGDADEAKATVQKYKTRASGAADSDAAKAAALIKKYGGG